MVYPPWKSPVQTENNCDPWNVYKDQKRRKHVVTFSVKILWTYNVGFVITMNILLSLKTNYIKGMDLSTGFYVAYTRVQGGDTFISETMWIWKFYASIFPALNHKYVLCKMSMCWWAIRKYMMNIVLKNVPRALFLIYFFGWGWGGGSGSYPRQHVAQGRGTPYMGCQMTGYIHAESNLENTMFYMY